MPINASNFQACIAKIADRGRISQNEASDLLEQLADRAEAMRRTGVQDALVKATKELSGRLKDKAAKDRIEAIRNAAIRGSIFDQVLANGGLQNAHLTLLSRMVNINTKLPKMEAPAEEAAFGLLHRAVSTLDVELEKAGLSKVVQSGSLDKEISSELFKLSQIGPKQPPKPNNLAGRAALIIHQALYDSAERLKAAGARFDHALDYVTHTTWDPRQMRDAGFDEWLKKDGPRMADRTFDDLSFSTPEGPIPEERAKTNFQRSVYNALITGVHMTSDHLTSLTADDSGYIPPAFEGTKNMAARFSHQRVVYWKDGESWYDHMREFGGMTTLLSTVHRVLASAANAVPLMEKFGTNPMGSLGMLTRKLQEHYRDVDPEGVIKFNKQIPHLENVMGRLDGSLNIPVNEDWSRWTSTLRTIESTTMLGNVGLTHFMSLPTTLGTMAPHYGIGRAEIYANLMNSLVAGVTRPEEREQILSEAGAFSHGTYAHFLSQLRTSDNIPGRMSAVAAIFLKSTGLNYILENTQNGLRFLLMHHLGRQVDKPFADLDPLLQNSMTRYGMNEQVWDMMRQLPDLKVFEGRTYLTPKDLERLADDAVDNYNRASIDRFKADIDQKRAQHEAMDLKEEEWHQGRIDKLKDKAQSLTDWINGKGQKRDANFQKRLLDGLARIDEMRENIASIQSVTDLIQSLKGIGAKDRIQQILEEVEGGYESERAAEKTGAAVEQQARANLSAGETLGRRRAQIERRMKDLREKFEEQGGEVDAANKADAVWLQNRIEELHDNLSEAYQRMQERIQTRADYLNELENEKLPNFIDRLRRQTRWELADNYAAFLAHAGRTATVAAGARERAWALGATRPGSAQGELWRFISQYKMWPLAVINQIMGREFYSQQSNMAKAWNVGLLIGLSTLGGAMRMAIRDLASNSPQRDYSDPKTLLAALAQGGGVGIYGDFLFGEANRMGGGVLNTLAGPVIGDAAQLANIFFKFRDDAYGLANDKVHHKGGPFADVWPDLARWGIHHIPGANLIGLKGALDYLLWYHIYESLSPGYWERVNRKLERETGRSMIGYQAGNLPPTFPFGLGDRHGFFPGQ